MKQHNLEKAARLGRALAEFGDLGRALKKKHTQGESGLCIDAGYIEDDHGELVQPDCGIVVDAETGAKIIAAVKPIIEAELKRLGVSRC